MKDLCGKDIVPRCNVLKMKAAQRHNIRPERCHIGIVALEGMLQRPNVLNQIDGATGRNETNLSVATRSMRLATAMVNAGVKPGDAIIIMGPNHLDLAIPFNASHFNGHSMCSVDPSIASGDLQTLCSYIQPKMVFCQKDCVEKVEQAISVNNLEAIIVTFDDEKNNLDRFVKKYHGTETDFKPTEFDTSETPAWLILTSGTTGVPKVAVITYDTLYNGIMEWWITVPEVLDVVMTMSTTQWLSALVFFLSAPLASYTRLQSSLPLNPHLMIDIINKYKPNATAWTPFLLARFVMADQNACDLSSLKLILVGGSAMEKHILDKFRERCKARLALAYGMTELLVGVFRYNDSTPFGSVGKPYEQYQYRLMDDNDKEIEGICKSGELWIKGGNAFFKGYLNNPEETRKVLTADGWFKTGDMFYRDENDYYYFVERKKILIRYLGNWVSPLQLEEVIKRHPAVAEACVFSVPDPQFMELAVGAIQKKPGITVGAQEIFDHMKEHLPEGKLLHGGLFFVESFPETPSGKINRPKVSQMAREVHRILPK